MSEKLRKSTRFIANFDGVFRLLGSEDWQNCHIYDISSTGALIRMKQTIIPGDILELYLDEESRVDKLRATVVNVNGQIAGVKFTTQDANKIVDLAIEKAFNKYRPNKKR